MPMIFNILLFLRLEYIFIILTIARVILVKILIEMLPFTTIPTSRLKVSLLQNISPWIALSSWVALPLVALCHGGEKGTRSHSEESFRNLINSNWNQIVVTIFRLIWNQTDVRTDTYTIYIYFTIEIWTAKSLYKLEAFLAN